MKYMGSKNKMKQEKTFNVISLFNGMGTLRQAFSDMNIKVDKYYSSEIKPYAIELQQHHFPDVIQVGDINNWKQWDIDWKTIDFIGSGSPCQDLSIAGKRAGINGNKSRLFWVFIEILEYVKKLNPDVIFLQENVGKASKLDIGIMSRALGVYPVRINSSLLTAQLRDRYYWTNIRTKETMFDVVVDIPQPKDKNISLQDVIDDGFTLRDKATALLQSEAKTFSYKDMDKFKDMFIKRVLNEQMNPNVVYSFVDRDKARALLESESRPLKNKEKLYNRYRETGMQTIVYHLEKNILKIRILSKAEMCKLQGFPGNFCDILTRNKAASLLGDGWTLPVIKHILSFMK